jgi:hypothetical protein
MSFGFILTRHVRSEETNKYWNQSVKLIRAYYPNRKIVVIDDNSNYDYVKAEFDYKNLTIIQSEWPGRGELLPYIYLLKYKWFPAAVIIHDSLFIHKRIPFERYNIPVIPLWHHPYDKEHLPNLLRIASVLTNNSRLLLKLKGDETDILKLNINKFTLCFGCQAFIKLSFLSHIQKKYNITNLLNVIHNRRDRCGLERVLGLIFNEEYTNLFKYNSLFGNISLKQNSFHYTYDMYINDINNKKLLHPFIKVWTGR